jgi:hypothetical protein
LVPHNKSWVVVWHLDLGSGFIAAFVLKQAMKKLSATDLDVF